MSNLEMLYSFMERLNRSMDGLLFCQIGKIEGDELTIKVSDRKSKDSFDLIIPASDCLSDLAANNIVGQLAKLIYKTWEDNKRIMANAQKAENIVKKYIGTAVSINPKIRQNWLHQINCELRETGFEAEIEDNTINLKRVD